MDAPLVAVAVFVALVALRWSLVAFGAALLLRPHPACPACFRETIPVRRRFLPAILPTLQWRWCPYCRWEGPARAPGEPRWTEKSAGSPG